MDEFFEVSDSTSCITLHILLDIQKEDKLKVAYLDQILFKILVAKFIETEKGFISFERFNYFEIEVGNTYRLFLQQELSMLRVLESKVYWKETHAHIEEVKQSDIDLDLLVSMFPNNKALIE